MTDPRWDIQFEPEVECPPTVIQTLRTAVRAVLHRHRCESATVTITIVGDERMRYYHQRFLNQSTTTDVISFDLTDEFEQTCVFDLIVNAELAVVQAQQRGHSPEAELTLYVIHGLLHNLGFDDGTPREAARMHRTEEAVLETLGFGGIYYGRKQNTESDG